MSEAKDKIEAVTAMEHPDHRAMSAAEVGSDCCPPSEGLRGDAPALPADGSHVRFHGCGEAWLSREGAVVIESAVGPPAKRAGFESDLASATEAGLRGWERAHAQGAGTGVESPFGILHAPRLVNQELQNRGIEAEVRMLQAQKRDDVRLFLRTEVHGRSGTSCLREINYQVSAVRAGDSRRRILFEASIEISGSPGNPRVAVSAHDFARGAELERYLRPPAEIGVSRPAGSDAVRSQSLR